MADTGIYDEDFDDIDSVFEAQSDTDSNFAESPADGYFSNRPHPSDVFVENSSVSAVAEAKAREAAEQRASSSSQVPPSRTGHTASSPQSVAWAEVAAAPLNTEPPPPDYETATQASSSRYASPTSPQHFDYGSLSGPYLQSGQIDHAPFGQPERSAAAQHGHTAPYSVVTPTVQGQLQSMSDSARQQPPVDEETGLLEYRPPRRTKRWCGLGSCCRPISMCNGILVLAVVILIVILTGGTSEASRDDDGIQRPQKPGHSPDKKTPTAPVNPALPSTPPVSSNCSYEYYSETWSFEFNGLRNFSFGEFIDRPEYLSGGLGGQVIIRPAGEGQLSDIKLDLTYATTRPWRVLQSNYVKMENAFILRSPDVQGTHDAPTIAPCMYVFVAIYVRSSITLESWETTTSSLDIEVLEGLFDPEEGGKQSDQSMFRISGHSTFTAVRGHVKAAYWSSRETVIEVIAGSISGTYALLDLLSFKSQAGSIKVDVSPKKVDKDRPRPAEALFHTVAGSITARYPREGYIPEREYKTRVEGVSSSVRGSWILGSLTSIHTQSGSITADFLPFFDRDAPAKFYTDTRSGNTKLTVLPPYDYPGQPWAKTSFKHKSTSTSGALGISYPPEWEGVIKAQAISGSVRVRGEGVKIIEDEKLGPLRMVAAIKGKGTNDLETQTTSGSIKITVGDP